MTGREEVVLTSRRAQLRTPGHGWRRGRIRVSDREVRFTGRDGATVTVPVRAVAAVRMVRGPRRALRLETPDGPILIRCFAMPAVAALLTR